VTPHEQLVDRGRTIVREAPELYIDADVEADGTSPRVNGSLLSVGAVSPWGETFYAELKPSTDTYEQDKHDFCEAHGLERERLMDEGEEPAVVMERFNDWAHDLTQKYDKKKSAVFTAFMATFDYPMIDTEMRLAGIPKHAFGIGGYCIKSLAMALPGAYSWRGTAKGRLPAEIVPEGDFSHNALEDSIYQQKIHFALAGKIAALHEVGKG
jgi:hypothetical protein